MNQHQRPASEGQSTLRGQQLGALGDAAGVLRRHARAMPDKPAVHDSRGNLSWTALVERVQNLAARLQADGVTEGTPVLVLADTCIETIVVYWALRSLGAVTVIADPGCTRSEFVQYVAATQPRWAFSTRAGTWERLGLDAPASPAIPAMRWYLQEHGESAHALREWSSRALAGEAAADRFADARDARVVLFSSGTTGVSKAIVHTEASIEALNRLHADVWGLSPADVVLGSLPFHTIYGSIYTAASAIYNGATLGLMERFKPDAALLRIEGWEVTTAAMVPAMLTMMLHAPGKERAVLTSLRAIYVGAAPISDKVIDDFARFARVTVLGSYGLTEIPGAAVERSDHPHVEGVAGRICPGFEVAVRDPEGKVLAAGETGEITLRGPSMMLGYLGKPDLTRSRIRDGWVYTQDIGKADPEGNISIFGRESDMIIRGGLNIAPKEIEHVLIQHPDVVAAAVTGIEDDVYGQVVKAYVVPRAVDEDFQALGDRLRSHCRAHLNRSKVPEEIAFLREFPMNAGGKVLKSELTGPVVKGRLLATLAPHDRQSDQASTPISGSKAR